MTLRNFRIWVVTLSVLYLLFAILRVGFDCSIRRASCIAAETQIRSFDECLEMFHAENGFYPSTQQGLNTLVEKADNRPRWRRAYLDRVPLDPWGNFYQYRNPGIHKIDAFEIYSFGKDGITNSEGNDPDDINNWDSEKKWSPIYGIYGSSSENAIYLLRLLLPPTSVFIGILLLLVFYRRKVKLSTE